MNRSDRNSGFELLRLLCVLGVIYEHFYEGGIMNAQGIVAQSSQFNAIVLRCIYYLARPAVNVFLLISGYFMVTSQKRKAGKLIDLFSMVCFYQVVCYFISSIVGHEKIRITAIFVSLFPRNYYLFLYATLYILSPYINRLIASLSLKKFKILLLTMLFLFSVYSTFINFGLQLIEKEEIHGIYTVLDVGTGRGFSIVGFALMYFIGAYIRKKEVQIHMAYLIFVLISQCLFNTFITTVVPRVSSALNNYDSITIIVESVCIFLIFKNLSFNNKLINKLSASVFGIYILHISILRLLCPMLEYENFLKMQGVLMILFFVLGVLCLTFIIAACIDIILRFMVKPVASRWKSNRLYSFDMAFADID